ncbi:MAG: B12-binding domain-containing radical SAM protein [Promethearchaeota archaeon]|nr:MAG: B12-binding domain-containing radical SAM protein [Candidatus Lokiarchaeota archaeon]
MKNLDFLMLISPQKPHPRPFDVYYPFLHQLVNKKEILPIQYGVMSILGKLRDEFEIGYYDLAHFKYLTQDSLKSTIKTILNKFNPKCIGIQSYTFNFNALRQTVKYIKDYNPDIITIAGGQHVTFLDKRSINECHGDLDIVVRGEGEKIIYNLLSKLVKNKPIDDVNGITTKDFRNQDEKLLSEDELNALPLPAFEIIPEIEKSNKYIYFPISVSRGCVYKCLFCVNHHFWKRSVRIMSSDRAMDILKYFIDLFGFKKTMLEFCDTILPLRISNFKSLVNKYIQEINKPVLFALTRANFTDDTRLELLRKLLQGYGVLSIGLENGNEEVLKLMNKPSFELSVKALNKIKSHNLKVTPSWLIGHPGETLKTNYENLEKIEYLFNKKLINTLIPFIWVPLPGTPPFDNPKKYNLKIVSYNWDRYDRAIFLPPYHLLDENDHTKIILSNQQIWAYFLNVISLCNKYSKNFKLMKEKLKISFHEFLNKVQNDQQYTLFSPGKDAEINYFIDLDPYIPNI